MRDNAPLPFILPKASTVGGFGALSASSVEYAGGISINALCSSNKIFEDLLFWPIYEGVVEADFSPPGPLK